MTTAETIVNAARACMDTPFQHQGRIVGLALDCAGVAVHAARVAGFAVDEPYAYSARPNNSMLESWVERQPFLTRVADMKSGDLLLMRFVGEPQHLAIYAGGTIIHAYQAIGRTVEHGLDDKWRKRIVRVYRFTGNNNE